MRRSTWVIACWLVACGNGGPGGDSAAPTTGSTGTGSTSQPLGTLYVRDYATGLAVADVAVAVDGQTFATDADGVLLLDLPPLTLFDLELSHPSYLPVSVRTASGGGVWSLGEQLVTPALADALLMSLGQVRDPSKAVLVVSVEVTSVDADVLAFDPLVGATVSLTTPQGVAFVIDAAGDPVAGATLLEGGGNFVAFANVDPGEISFVIDRPNGETCVTAAEHDVLVDHLTAVGGAIASTIASCH